MKPSAAAGAVWCGVVLACLAGDLVVLTPAIAFGDPVDAGIVDAGAADAPETDDATWKDPSLAERAGVTRRQIRAIRTLLAGSLPDDLYTAELFEVDLLDDAAVERRKAELTQQVAEQKRRENELADAGPRMAAEREQDPDGGVGPSPIDLVELDLAEARLAFLAKPHVDREAVLASEAGRRRVSQEQDEAHAAKKVAEQQQRNADAAQRRALQEAARTENATQRALANERARVEGVRSDLAEMRSKLAAARAADSSDARTRSSTTFELTDAARRAPKGSDEADALYDRLVGQLEIERAAMNVDLDALRKVEKAPRYTPDPVALASVDPGTAPQRKQLEKAAHDLAGEASEIESAASTQAWSRLQSTVERERQFNDARLALLDRVSPEKRSDMLGFGPEGIAQLRREMFDVRLVARWRAAWAQRGAPGYVASLRSGAALVAAATKLFLFVLLVAGAGFARRNVGRWIGALRASLPRALRGPVLRRPVGATLEVAEALSKPLVFAGAVWLSPGVLDFATDDGSLLATCYRLLGALAIYRLAIVESHRLIARAASTPIDVLAAGRSEKVLRSLRVVGRYAIFVSVLLTLSAAILGRGYLFNVVLRFAWLGAGPIAALLIRWWRDDIATEFLKRRAHGPLADAVTKTQRRWFGFFVAIVAVGYLFVAWIATSAQRFVLGFEHSRKALAYLFRRRLQKQAIESGHAPDGAALPADLRRLFEQHTADPRDAIERYPEMERFLLALQTWRDEPGSVGALLLVGKTGFGKTSWIDEALRRAGEAATVPHVLDSRALTTEALATVLSAALGVTPEVARDLEALRAVVSATPRRLVVLDDVQNLFLRGVGTLEAWRRFNDVVVALGDRVFWLCACAHYPNEYLAWARRHGDVFRAVVKLPAWSEAEIAELIRRRMERSGYEAVYSDLIVEEAVEGVDAQAQLVNTGGEYMRLIWDYAEGSPRAALHCWLQSLVPDGEGQVRVRLFRQPDSNVLEQLEEEPKFVLAAVVWHENLSAAEAARALQFTAPACDATLARLRELGILTATGAQYRVSTAWWAPVIRYLRRKHLVHS